MLDQLVESKSTASGNGTRRGIFLTTALVMFSIAFGGLLYSLFAQNIGVGGDGLELSTLVAPVPLPEEAPPEPEPEPEKKINKTPDVDIRKEIIRNIDESPVKPPKDISSKKSDVPARRMNVATMKGTVNSNSTTVAKGPTRTIKGNAGDGIGRSGPPTTKTPEPKKAPPPPPPPPKRIPKRISGGVVNGKAISLPKPPYPAAARAVRAKGRVSVAVVISKTGRVISASAKGGHPLLRRAAVQAARRAKFRPTKLSGVAVEVTGVIVYNFRP